MGYLDHEQSLEGGAPVELYEITLGSDIYRFTSAQDTVTALGNAFYPVEVERDSLVSGPENRDDLLELHLPASYPLVRKYIEIVPGKRAYISVYRFHRFDTPSTEVVLYWQGLLRTVTFTAQGRKATIAALPITGAMSRRVPRYGYQGLCNHMVFDERCKAVEASFRHNGRVLSVTNNVLEIENLSAKGDNWARSGYVTVSGLDYRVVIAHTGDEIRLLLPFPDDIPLLGSNVDVYAGCAHTPEDCINKFNNFVNYGGFPWVPRKNPYQTGIG